MMAWKKTGVLLATALLLGGLVIGEAEARGQRLAQVPNSALSGCNTCHTTGGGSPRNPFGLEVQNNFLTEAGASGAVMWGPELAALDSDGDGVSNGVELGDPDGTWVPGDADPEGEIFAPGDPDSTPPIPEPVATAVAASSWAQIKSLVNELD